MTPFISVIIPVYNDPRGLADTVGSLLRQDYPAERYEVVVVDNASEDDTPRVAESFAAAQPSRVRTLSEREIRSSYAARNRGVRAARGEILCFLDADMTAPPTYLASLERRFAEGDVDYLGCPVTLSTGRNTLAETYDRVLGFQVERYLRDAHFAPTCCLAVRADVCARVGLFDATLASGGDWEFGVRVWEHGLRQACAGDIVLSHPARATLRALAAKRRRVARGHAVLESRFPARFPGLEASYRVRRRIRPPSPGRLLALARQRGIPLSAWRALGLSGIGLYLDLTGTCAFRRETRRLAGARRAREGRASW